MASTLETLDTCKTSCISFFFFFSSSLTRSHGTRLGQRVPGKTIGKIVRSTYCRLVLTQRAILSRKAASTDTCAPIHAAHRGARTTPTVVMKKSNLTSIPSVDLLLLLLLLSFVSHDPSVRSIYDTATTTWRR